MSANELPNLDMEDLIIKLLTESRGKLPGEEIPPPAKLLELFEDVIASHMLVDMDRGVLVKMAAWLLLVNFSMFLDMEAAEKRAEKSVETLIEADK